ncbi:hypothetical protein BHE74_00048686 [Ensete ventricosum]|nr:hypothetical protein GW17_00033696 [Ensete ventricosum]RWW45470.1 hypothetical protein BHE74_00048686 [Ensete ventricosum]
MRIYQNCWVIAKKVNHSQGCWCLIMHLMGHYMSIYIVSQTTDVSTYVHQNVKAFDTSYGLLLKFRW